LKWTTGFLLRLFRGKSASEDESGDSAINETPLTPQNKQWFSPFATRPFHSVLDQQFPSGLTAFCPSTFDG
jgi:hypothetical protein